MKNISATDLIDIPLLKFRCRSIDRKGIPPGLSQGEYPSYLYFKWVKNTRNCTIWIKNTCKFDHSNFHFSFTSVWRSNTRLEMAVDALSSLRVRRRAPRSYWSHLIHHLWAQPPIGTDVPFPQPSTQDIFIQCWYNVGPASQMLAQHWSDAGGMSSVRL